MPRLLLLTLLLLPGLGCGLLEPVQRAQDASQMVAFGVGVSATPGFYAWALAPVFGSSLGYQHDSIWVGHDYGYTHLWRQAGYGVLIGGELVRAEWDQSVEGFFERPLHQAYLDQSQILLLDLTVTDERLAAGARSIGLRRVELGAHVLFVGATLGIDLFATLDFVAGLFGFDPSGDDGLAPRHAPFPLESAAGRRDESTPDRPPGADGSSDPGAPDPSGQPTEPEASGDVYQPTG